MQFSKSWTQQGVDNDRWVLRPWEMGEFEGLYSNLEPRQASLRQLKLAWPDDLDRCIALLYARVALRGAGGRRAASHGSRRPRPTAPTQP